MAPDRRPPSGVARPPGAAGPPGAVVLWALGLATAAASAAAVALALQRAGGLPAGAAVALVGWTTVPFIGAGMIAWRRRPDSRFGPLLVAAGLVTPVSTLQWSDQPVLNTIGSSATCCCRRSGCTSSSRTRPGGSTGAARLIVVAGYVAALVLQVVVLTLGGFDERHLLAVVAGPTWPSRCRTCSCWRWPGCAWSVSSCLAAGRPARRGGRPRCWSTRSAPGC